jgi:hypothetical protein
MRFCNRGKIRSVCLMPSCPGEGGAQGVLVPDDYRQADGLLACAQRGFRIRQNLLLEELRQLSLNRLRLDRGRCNVMASIAGREPDIPGDRRNTQTDRQPMAPRMFQKRNLWLRIPTLPATKGASSLTLGMNRPRKTLLAPCASKKRRALSKWSCFRNQTPERVHRWP